MRIIAGALKGRQLSRPKTRSVRPLSNQVREALYNVTGQLVGAFVLDAYAGSGAVGFEALSRGAAEVDAVEASASVARNIVANVELLGLEERYQLHVEKVENWLKGGVKPGYDLIVADPPYDQLDSVIIQKLAKLLVPEGIMVLSHSSRITPPTVESVQLVQSRKYGDSTLTFYKRI